MKSYFLERVDLRTKTMEVRQKSYKVGVTSRPFKTQSTAPWSAVELTYLGKVLNSNMSGSPIEIL